MVWSSRGDTCNDDISLPFSVVLRPYGRSQRRGPPMQQIADWLEKFGLGQYAQRFAENEIDVAVLCHLTDQDLREIGVPLGHRRKMLAAIREGMGSPSPAPAEPVTDLEPTRQD